MTTRRKFLAVASLAAGAAALEKAGATAIGATITDSDHGAETDLTRLVNVFCGTGGHGHCFPGATAPFGAVYLVPSHTQSVQTTAPSSFAPSIFFFGWMKCSRETPSHIASGLATRTEE